MYYLNTIIINIIIIIIIVINIITILWWLVVTPQTGHTTKHIPQRLNYIGRKKWNQEKWSSIKKVTPNQEKTRHSKYVSLVKKKEIVWQSDKDIQGSLLTLSRFFLYHSIPYRYITIHHKHQVGIYTLQTHKTFRHQTKQQ